MSTNLVSRRGVLAASGATAAAVGCTFIAAPAFSSSTETAIGRLHGLWLRQTTQLDECMAALEGVDGAEFEKAIDPKIDAKWDTETKILAMPPETVSDARIQLTVLLAAYKDCDYTPEVFDRVIKSVVRALA